MGRLNIGVEFHVISPAVPGVTSVAQEIVDLVGLAFDHAKLVDRHINITVLFAEWVEIHHDQDDVVPRRRHLPVTKDRVVIGVKEPKVIVKMKARFPSGSGSIRVIQSLMLPGASQSRSFN